MGTNLHSRRSWLLRLLVIAFAILSGVGTYLLVITIFNEPQIAPPAARQTAVRDLTAPGPGGVPQPICFGLTKTDLTVGQPADLTLDIYDCPGSDLAEFLANAATGRATSADIAISGPVQTKSPTGPSWTWKATANTPGQHEVDISLEVDASIQPLTRATITSHNASKDRGRVLQWLSGGSAALKSIAGAMGSIVTILTAVAAIVALRRTRTKTESDQAVRPTATDANFLSGVKDNGGDRGGADQESSSSS